MLSSPPVPTDSLNSRQHRAQIARSVNALLAAQNTLQGYVDGTVQPLLTTITQLIGQSDSDRQSAAQTLPITVTGDNNTNAEAALLSLVNAVTTNDKLSSAVANATSFLYAGITAQGVALAEATTQLNASIGNLSSNLSFEQIVRASGDATNAAAITSLQSALAGYTASNAVATAVSSLQTQITTADGNISANASAITTLSTTVAGNTASITTLQSSVNGINAQWGVSVNVNGAVTGAVELSGGSSTSSFIVEASNIEFVDPTLGNTPLFQITGGTAYLNVPLQAGAVSSSSIIDTGVVETSHIQNNAVSNVQAFDGAAMSIGNSDTIVCSGSLTLATTDTVIIQFTDYISRVGGTSPTMIVRLWTGVANSLTGATVQRTIELGGSGMQQNDVAALIASFTASSAGTMWFLITENSGLTTNEPTSNAPVMVLTQLKK